MHRMNPLVVSLVAALLSSAAAQAQTGNRAMLLPTAPNTSVTVLDATSLTSLGVIPGVANANRVLGLPDGSKYYVLANSPQRTITIVNAATLTVTRQIDLGANANDAALTPDGRRLLVLAGTLRIYDTSSDTEIGNVPVGVGPSQLEVGLDSTRAWVLSNTSQRIYLVDLTNNTPTALEVRIPGSEEGTTVLTRPLAMALAPSNTRLVALTDQGLVVINPLNGAFLRHVQALVISGRLAVTPDSNRVVLVTRGALTTSSQIVDLTTGATTLIAAGTIDFEQLAVADNSTALATESGTGRVVRIDLNTGSAAIQTYGAGTRSIQLTPSGRTAYLFTAAGAVTRVDIASNSAGSPVTSGVALAGASLVFPPPTTGAVNMAVNGGDRQIVVPGQNVPFPLSVKVTANDGSPVFNLPVTFTTNASGITLSPTQPSRTNSQGVAHIFVRVAAASSLQPAEEVQTEAASEEGVEQDVQTINITASAAGTSGASFSLLISTTTGITVVSGDSQIARPNQQFPEPLVVRVTGTDGFPLAGVRVNFFPVGGSLSPAAPFGVTTNPEGLAQAIFTAGAPPPGQVIWQTQVRAEVEGRGELGSVVFRLIISFQIPGPPQISRGNNQSGDTGTRLPEPLCISFDVGLPGIGVYWDVVSGPAGSGSAFLDSPFVLGVGAEVCNGVTVGPAVGSNITIRARVPGIGEALFTVIPTGGPPQTIDKIQGDNQESRPGQQLPLALRVLVRNLSGNPVPLPNPQYPLTFTASPENAATISNIFQQSDGQASALVTINSGFVGSFTVTARAGNGSAVFNLRSVAPAAALVRVSGSDQTVGVGGTTAQPLVAQVNDSLNNPVPGIAVTFSGPSTVTFVPSQGPSGNPITLNSGANGRAAVSVQVNAGTPLGVLTITASTSAGSVTFTLTVTGRVPSFTAAAIVNAASFVPGMVPGGLASLFGTGLSEITGCEQPGGATSHRGVGVRVDGVPVPLYVVCNQSGQEQINFQVRTDLAAPSQVRVEVENNGSRLTVANVPVRSAQPGIFELPAAPGSTVRYAAALRQNGSVVSATNRLTRGEVFVVFLTGMGPTLPTLLTGQVGPVPPAVTFFRPTVGVGGRGADVVFSGVAPGLVINQINAIVPADAPSGDVSLDIIVEGAASQTARLPIQ